MPSARRNVQLPSALRARLHRSIAEWLRKAPFEAPRALEDEAAFTDRVLVGSLKAFLDRQPSRNFGILVGGHHTGISRPVALLGTSFYPDLAIVHREERVIAIEVKYLSEGPDRSNNLAKALGQAVAYRRGYELVGVLIVDRSSRRFSIGVTEDFPGSVPVIVRRQAGGYLREGRLFYL